MGLLITVEGGEYTGKTSVVVPGLLQKIEKLGIPVLVSREPGGTREGEIIRQEIFQKAKQGADPYVLAELFNKARGIHLQQNILPFLGQNKEKNAIVILDRYLDSTRVYQGLEVGVPPDIIRKLESEHVKNYLPDITLLLYIPEEQFTHVLTERMNDNREKTTWDTQAIQEHLARQRLYLQLPNLSKKWGENREFALVNTAQTPEKVVADAYATCLPYIRQHFAID